MSKLTTYKFCKLYEISSGISSKPEQAGHGSPFLSFSTVYNNYFIPEKLDDLMDTSEEEQKKYSVLKGDIFLTRTSEVIDELAMSSVSLKDYPGATYSGFLKRLRPLQDNITYHKFMAFYLRSKLFRKTMTNNAVLTLRASLNENIFSYLDLILPDYDEQVKVGELLHLVNRKIDLNNRINAELEAMAKTLYDYWFVQFDFPFDFAQGKPGKNGKPYKSSGGKMVWNKELKREIPEGWGVKELGMILDTSLGGTPSTHNKSYWVNGQYNWLNSGEIAEFPIVSSELKITKEAIKKSAADLLPKGTTLLSITRHLRPTILAIDACANQSVVGIKEKGDIKSYYIYPYLKNEIPRYLVLRTGAQQPHINKETVDSSLMVLPTENSNILEKYNKIAGPLYDQIINSAFQNQHLSSLRDWLLPMLMNGQLKVS
ncbi:MAG: restriction endonuclease subunit S [Deltaproteobacteria bacterium]|nr:restriction endonuclease subunit S [Deltaproteobacteria bacterium]